MDKYPFNRCLVVYSYLCNFDCAYCMHKDLRRKVGEDNRIAEDRLLANYDYMIDGRRPDEFISITFSGGEPLMVWKDFIVKSVDYIRSKPNGKQVKLDMFTNGYLLTEEKLAYLKENDVYVCISFDGGGQHERSRSQAEYDRIYANIQMGLAALGDHFSVASTFNGNSITDISSTQSIVSKLGIKKWTFAIDTLHSFYYLDDYETIADQLLQLYKNHKADPSLILPETFNRYTIMQDYFDSNHSYILKPKGIALGTTMPFLMPEEVASTLYIGEFLPDESLIAAHRAKFGDLVLGFVGWNDNENSCAGCAHQSVCKNTSNLTSEAVAFRRNFRRDGSQCMIPYIIQKTIKEGKELLNEENNGQDNTDIPM